MIRLLLVILVALSIPPPGSELPDSMKPTLSEEDYAMAKTVDSNFPDNAQILYCEYNGMVGTTYEGRKLQVYGDGRVLVMDDIHNSGQETMCFFLSDQPNMLEDLAEASISQGLFEMHREGYIFMDLPRSETHSYYLSLRVNEKYFTLHFSALVGEEPSWLALTEPFHTIIDQLMVEENEITGTQYLEVREEIISKYGYHIMCGDAGVKKYVDKTENAH